MHRLSFHLRLIASVAICLATARCGAAAQDSRTASELTNRLYQRYATAAMYRDRGTLYSENQDFWTIVHAFFGNRTERPFTTEFDRSRDTLRFQLAPITLAGKSSHMRQQLIEAATPTAKVSTFVPLLLLGDRNGDRPPGTMNMRRLPDEHIKGSRCYVLAFTDRANIDTRLMIESDTFTIRRIRREYPIGDSKERLQRIIDYTYVEIQ